MKITHLRNAALVIEFKAGSRSICLLVDPMLARAGELPALRLGGRRRRNPIVDLPEEWHQLSNRVTHALITHCQRGHFDHLDRRGVSFLRQRSIPVFCMPRDDMHLQRKGLRTMPLAGVGRQDFFSGSITPVPCVHGRGLVGRFMEHGSGYLIEIPQEPRVYIAGDTILTPVVRSVLADGRPDVAILPAGGARFDVGGAILMNGGDVLEACSLTPGVVIANHLEALDHCPTTRAELAAMAREARVEKRLRIPEDGEALEFVRQPPP